ncbi:hypothetical protein TNCV_3554911 [Trichonephila clavipes]|nr:hypothetical protein TNCV_3554911 [Trichonephila clavipes]
MNEDRCYKKIFLAKSMGNRPRGRPPLRWINCVEKGLKILKVENWKKVAKLEMPGKDFWKRPGPTQGCRAIEEEEEKKGVQEIMMQGSLRTSYASGEVHYKSVEAQCPPIANTAGFFLSFQQNQSQRTPTPAFDESEYAFQLLKKPRLLQHVDESNPRSVFLPQIPRLQHPIAPRHFNYVSFTSQSELIRVPRSQSSTASRFLAFLARKKSGIIRTAKSSFFPGAQRGATSGLIYGPGTETPASCLQCGALRTTQQESNLQDVSPSPHSRFRLLNFYPKFVLCGLSALK